MSSKDEVRKCTECGAPLTDEECFEFPEPRPCDECAGHTTPELQNE